MVVINRYLLFMFLYGTKIYNYVIINRYLLCLYMELSILSFKDDMMWQDFN